MTANVDNFFDQTTTNSTDNKFTVGGTIQTLAGASLKTTVLTARIADVSTAGQVFILVPFAGTLLKVSSVLNGAITVADAVLTVKTAGGTAGTITIANSGSAAEDIDTLEPAANNTVLAGGLIEIETSGASTGAVGVDLTLEFALD
ncbi:MAG: hypothetical protein ACUZ8E_17510 [Candidatus Anammoxibacter sp.]